MYNIIITYWKDIDCYFIDILKNKVGLVAIRLETDDELIGQEVAYDDLNELIKDKNKPDGFKFEVIYSFLVKEINNELFKHLAKIKMSKILKKGINNLIKEDFIGTLKEEEGFFE